MKLDSLSQLRYQTMQDLPEFVRSDNSRPHVIGTQNYNGKCVFDCVPYAGTIPGGESSPLVLLYELYPIFSLADLELSSHSVTQIFSNLG